MRSMSTWVTPDSSRPCSWMLPHAMRSNAQALKGIAHAGNTGKEYRTKYRTLSFNMKDANNPDLRARVLRKELLPNILVRMSNLDLASKVCMSWLAVKGCQEVLGFFQASQLHHHADAWRLGASTDSAR